jgi:hypothetical protein
VYGLTIMARLYRLHPDSSYLKEPRVFARVFCDNGTLLDTVRFYENLTSETLDMDLDIPESGLHVGKRLPALESTYGIPTVNWSNTSNIGPARAEVRPR